MEITLSSFIPYPSIAVITPHLTLLTSYRLVAYFPANSNFTCLLHLNSVKARIFVDIMTRNINALKNILLPINLLRDALFH